MSSASITMQLSSSETVENLKRRIQMFTGIPACEQLFVFGEITLEDSKRLCDYNIEEKSEIHLILGLKSEA